MNASAAGIDPNQVGPEEMGWRTTAQNLNLNRDYVKAEAPEMQAMLRLLNEWDPILYVDLHVTDGAEFEHDVSYNVAPTLAGDEELRAVAVALRDELLKRMTAQGSLPLDFYPSFVRDDDPASGFAVGVPPPSASPGVLGGAQPHRRAGRDAFLEGLSDARAHHAQHDHRADGDGGARRTRMAGGGERRRRARARRSAERACRSPTRTPTMCA